MTGEQAAMLLRTRLGASGQTSQTHCRVPWIGRGSAALSLWL